MIAEFVSEIEENPKNVNALPIFTLDYKVKIFKIRESILLMRGELLKLLKKQEIEFSSHPTPEIGASVTVLREYVMKFQDTASFLNQAVNELSNGTTISQKISDINAEKNFFEEQLDAINVLMRDTELTDDELNHLNN
jgi:hypothetical protein